MGNQGRRQKEWVREEVVVLVAEYFKTKNLPAGQIEENYCKISEFLRNREEILTGRAVDNIYRNYAGIRMQSARIKCLDPETRFLGMQGTKIQKKVVEEYLEDPQHILAELERIYEKYR